MGIHCSTELNKQASHALRMTPAFDSSKPWGTRTLNQVLNLPLQISLAHDWVCGLDYIFTISGALLIVSEDSLSLFEGCLLIAMPRFLFTG